MLRTFLEGMAGLRALTQGSLPCSFHDLEEPQERLKWESHIGDHTVAAPKPGYLRDQGITRD